MKKLFFIYVVFSFLAPASFADSDRGSLSNDEFEKLNYQAQQLVRKFASELKPSLLNAMSEGGISRAINVCSTLAPKLADHLSEESGWTIRRVSLKPRNSRTASPDVYERSVLNAFNQRVTQGEAASKLVASTVAADKFRFMKAQPVEALCLNCHGSTISNNVSKALQSIYPDDMATGYEIGDIRGAFSLSKTIE